MVSVISLQSAEKRRDKFSEVNHHLRFEFFDAVIGAAIGLDVRENRNFFAAELNYSDGSLGNALSHFLLWKNCIESGQSMTIAEDDSIFRDDFLQTSQEMLNQVGEDWDIIYWGFNFDSPLYLMLMPEVSGSALIFDQASLRKNNEVFKKSTDKPWMLPLNMCCGLPAYIVSPSGAEKLLNFCFPLSNINKITGQRFSNVGLDTAMGAVGAHIRALVSVPPLVITNNYKYDSSANLASSDIPLKIGENSIKKSNG